MLTPLSISHRARQQLGSQKTSRALSDFASDDKRSFLKTLARSLRAVSRLTTDCISPNSEAHRIGHEYEHRPIDIADANLLLP